MTDNLHTRIAHVLGWSVTDTQTMSLLSLRELVSPVSPALAHEITMFIHSSECVATLPGCKRRR